MTTSNNRGHGRTTLVLAGVLVGLVALAAVVVLILNLVQQPSPAPTPTSSSTTSAPPTEPAGSESICGLPPSDETTLRQAPAAEWSPVGTIAAPSDPNGEHGPGVQEDGGFRSCYSHSPAGALLAVSNYLALTSEPSLAPRLPELVQAGSALSAPTESGMYSDTRLSIVGFRLLSYDAERAVIDLAVRVDSSQGVLLTTPFEVVWEDGDWKLVVGEEPPASAPLQSLGGYISFSGETDGP